MALNTRKTAFGTFEVFEDGKRLNTGTLSNQKAADDFIRRRQALVSPTQTPATRTTPRTPATPAATDGRFSRRRAVQEQERELIESLGETRPEAPVFEEVLEQKRQAAQSRADVIRSEFGQLIAQEEQAGQIRGQRGRALSIGGGLAGSEFAGAAATKIEEQTLRATQQIAERRQAEIANVFAEVEGRATEEFATQRESFIAEAEGDIERTRGFLESQTEIARTDIEALAIGGTTFEDLRLQRPQVFETLAEEVGGRDILKGMFIASIPEEDVIFEEVIDGQFVRVFTDRVTGETKRETLDLGLDVPENLELIRALPNGQLVFAPKEGFESTDDLVIFGRPGQFLKPERPVTAGAPTAPGAPSAPDGDVFSQQALSFRLGRQAFGSRISDIEGRKVDAFVAQGFAQGKTEDDILDAILGFNVTENKELGRSLQQAIVGFSGDAGLSDFDLVGLSRLLNANNVTGAISKVESSGMKAAQSQDPEGFMGESTVVAATNRANDIEDLINGLEKSPVGVVKGTMENWLGRLRGSDAAAIRAKITSSIAEMRKRLLGAQVTDSEKEFLEPKVPNLGDRPDTFFNKLQELKTDPLLQLNATRSLVQLPFLTEESLLDKNQRVDLHLGQQQQPDEGDEIDAFLNSF